MSEVREFRATVADPALTRDEKKRAYGQIIHHAALVDPLDAGFANVGVALKDALLIWLDAQVDARPLTAHSRAARFFGPAWRTGIPSAAVSLAPRMKFFPYLGD